MPTATISGYPADNQISWAQTYNGSIANAGDDPNSAGKWDDDAALTYGGAGLGYTNLSAFANYSFFNPPAGGYARTAILEIYYSPFRIPELDRDFMYANNGAAAVSTIRGNAKVAGFQVDTELRYYGTTDNIPGDYTVPDASVGLLAGPPHWNWGYKETTETFDTVSLSLLGAKPDGAGGWEHDFLFLDSTGPQIETDQFKPAEITDLLKCYMDNSGGYTLFELLAVDPSVIDLASDSSPSKFKSLLDAMMNESITWQWTQISDSSYRWLPFGTSAMKIFRWSGISVASSFIKYTGDFSLYDQDHVPPLALPAMD